MNTAQQIKKTSIQDSKSGALEGKASEIATFRTQKQNHKFDFDSTFNIYTFEDGSVLKWNRKTDAISASR